MTDTNMPSSMQFFPSTTCFSFYKVGVILLQITLVSTRLELFGYLFVTHKNFCSDTFDADARSDKFLEWSEEQNS